MSVGIGRVDGLIDERLFAAVRESACGTSPTFPDDRSMVAFGVIVLQNTAASFIWADLRIAQRSPLRASYGIIGAWQTGYAVQVTAADGGGRQRNLTRRRRF